MPEREELTGVSPLDKDSLFYERCEGEMYFVLAELEAKEAALKHRIQFYEKKKVALLEEIEDLKKELIRTRNSLSTPPQRERPQELNEIEDEIAYILAILSTEYNILEPLLYPTHLGHPRYFLNKKCQNCRKNEVP